MHKASSAGRLELENKNLRSQLEQYQQEFKDIKNQEVTIRRLQDQVKEYEGRMDSLVEEKMQENSTTIQTNLQSTIDQMQERYDSTSFVPPRLRTLNPWQGGKPHPSTRANQKRIDTRRATE